ncbi:hypothetical protein AAHA92_06007 [Salvia divinorum]|uniref:Arabidopsis retrotransposon Orf1 C-terminal domain-containing protein n=1 Tax=Salvia divinorum TaxID=28513 RepID=A0ABD1I6V5_SALDI
MAAIPTPNTWGLRLRTPEERVIWDNLAAMPCHPSRYPDYDALERLGISQCFRELAEAGGLTYLFIAEAQTYHSLTLEFLTTLLTRSDFALF